MRNRGYQISFGLILLGIYSLLFYFIFTYHQKLDFSSFYSAGLALLHGENPYKNLFTSYLPTNKILPTNLNPPIVLWLFSPLARFTYSTALLIWSVISFFLGFVSAGIVFRYAFSPKFLQENYLNLYLFYLAFFATLMNVTTLQLGTLLFFFLILGYHFYLNNRNSLAGILWGFVIAMKIFPGLLFIYVLKQGRFKVFWVMLITLLIASLVPVFVYGTVIYKQYYAMIFQVHWYGDNWNASIYGLIFRFFAKPNSIPHSILLQVLYIFLFFILFLWYLKQLGPTEIKPINHQPFCLTLAMMFLLSPLGWVYYFPILVFPMILLLSVALDEIHVSKKTIFIWLLCFFLINFPLDYVKTQKMTSFWAQISFYSCYFYGLLLLTYLLGKRKKIYGNNEIHFDETVHSFIPIIIIILAFGLSVPTICFVMRIVKMNLNMHFV